MRRLLVFIGFLVLGIVASPGAFGQEEASGFTSLARGACSPLPFCAIPERGEIWCGRGNEGSNQLMAPWCPAEGRTKVRGRELIYYIVQSADDRVSGPVKLVANMNLDSATLTGHVWGTYHIEVPNRGAWDGTWEGEAEGVMSKWVYKVVLVGSGEFEGLKLTADGVWQAGVGDMLSGEIRQRAHRR